jgi:general secretion pathway protein D
MVKSMTAMFLPQAGRGALAPIKIVADDRTNALIILATENDTARIRELLKLMDKEIPRGSGTIRVYYLQNAKAEDLVKVLTGLPQQARPAGAAGTPAAATTSGAIFSKNVQVMADKSTNSLIIVADTADYLVIEDVIRKLDITRPMVYLEALIMEVNANKSFGVGVEWSALKDVGATGVGDVKAGTDGARNVGVVGFKGGAPIIPQITSTGLSALPGGFSMGVIGAGITIGGVLFPNIGAVLQAYQNDSDVRILSTPQLLTLDNEDAEITVGSNVPYVTRQDSGVVGSTTNYSSYEYKDVGVTLKVTPQINKDGFIRMKLDQSVTKVISQSATVDTLGNKILTPTTDKRTAKTTVVVKSGETVVIGGMIEDTEDEGTYKVPLLGDIPLLGWLFKSRATVKKRTNLFVFITPRIIGQPEDARKIQEEKMDYMKTIQEGTIRTAPQKKTEAKEKE